MAKTRSFYLCTLLVAATLMQGCRGQCDGQVKVLVATEEAKTFGPPDFFITDPPDECEWLIRADDGYIVHIRKTMVDDDRWPLCSSGVSLYDGAHPETAELITTCIDQVHVFSTSGQNMYVLHHSRTAGWLDFTMEYWAAKNDDSEWGPIECGFERVIVSERRLGILPLLVGLVISSTTLCCCYCFCRSTKCRASPPSDFTSPAPFCDSAPPSSHTHHDDQGLVAMFTRGYSSTSRTDGIRANSSGAVPLLSAPQPEPSNVGRRSLADSPPAYDDLELVVIPTVGRNSSPSRPGGVHTSSSSAVPVTAAPPLEDFNMDRRSLVDSPPAYDAVVTSDINRSEENPQETLTVRLPSYAEAVAMVNLATKPK